MNKMKKDDSITTSDNYKISFTKRGNIKSIRNISERPLLKTYATVLRMGHSGNGYTTLKLVTTGATDTEEFKRKVTDIPRVKHDKIGAIISFTECSRVEGKFIQRINDNDKFLNSNSTKYKGQRMISKERLNHASGRESIEYDGTSGHDRDVIQEAYATYLVEDDYTNVHVIKNDRPLEGELLYEYFKQQTISALKRPSISQKDKVVLMMNYARIMPKYKKYIQADPNPFIVFFEELQPDDKRWVFRVQQTTIDPVTNEATTFLHERDHSKTQYALCYYNHRNEKQSVLIPNDNVKSIFKHPTREQIKEFFEIKKTKSENLRTIDEKMLLDSVHKLLSEEKLDVSSLEWNTKLTIYEIASYFSECEFNRDQTTIKKASWELDYDGEFLGEDFYQQKANSFEHVDDEAYEKFKQERNAKTMAKFKKFGTPQTQKGSEPGDEE